MENLVFHGPYPFCPSAHGQDLLHGCDISKDYGIYIFAAKQKKGGYRVTYIGETGTSFYKRIKEHAIQTLGGNYRICDAEKMTYGIQEIIWDGLWRKGVRNKIFEFIDKYEYYSPFVKAYIKSISIFLAPFHGSKEQRKNIEFKISSEIRSAGECASLLPSDIQYRYKKINFSGQLLQVQSFTHIEGLPSIVKF